MFNILKNRTYKFLRWSQKYTQTDMVYLAKGGSWLTLGQIISTAAAFLLAIAFANLLPKETYGTYKYVLSLVGILGIFSLGGIGTAMIQATARGLEGSFYSGFKTKLKWGILGSVTAIGLAGYYFLQGNYTLPIPLLISAIFLPLMLASGIYGSLLTGKKLFNVQVKYASLSQIVSAGTLIIALFLLYSLNLQTSAIVFILIAVYFVSHTFLNYSLYLITKRKFQPNKKEDAQALSFGKHLSLMNVFSQIVLHLDRILIFHYLGAIELAIYSFAIAPPQQIRGLFQNIRPLALPKLSQRSLQELKQTLPFKLLKFFLIILPIIVLYILLAPYIYKLFFPQYLDSIIYSQVFALGLLLFPKGSLGTALTAHTKKGELYINSLISSAIKLILLIILLPLYGIWGAIVAFLSTEIVNLLVLSILFKKS